MAAFWPPGRQSHGTGLKTSACLARAEEAHFVWSGLLNGNEAKASRLQSVLLWAPERIAGTLMIDQAEPLLGIALALALGLLIGLQRERTQSKLGGIRTFPLVSLFGAVCALLAPAFGVWVMAVGFLGVVGILALSTFLRMGEKDVEPGQTTEIAMLLTFALGAYVIEGNRPAAVVIGGIAIILLHLKEPMHRFVDKMGREDIKGIMQFVVITMIVLPLLPDRAFGPYKVLNPFDIWRMVVLIVALSLAGYVAYKIVGERTGTVLGGLFGGLISSTVTTVSYARRTARSPSAGQLAVVAILIASAVAYVRILIELSIVASAHFTRLALPLAIMLLLMSALSAIGFFLFRCAEAEVPAASNPAELKSALVFGGIYALVLLAVAAAKSHFGSSALYGVALLSGLTQVDAITLSVARMVNESRLDPQTAWRLVLIGSLSNLLFKWAAATFLGGWRLGLRLGLFFLIASLGGLAVIWFWPEGWSLERLQLPGSGIGNTP